MPYVRQHIRCSHCLQYVFTPVHLLHNHVYAIENTYAEEPQHQIKPFSDIQAVMDTCPQAKYHNDGCINATAHHNHILEVVTDGFYVADTYGDERDAGSIDEDVDDRPQTIVRSTESERHLYQILYRQSCHCSKDHPS